MGAKKPEPSLKLTPHYGFLSNICCVLSIGSSHPYQNERFVQIQGEAFGNISGGKLLDGNNHIKVKFTLSYPLFRPSSCRNDPSGGNFLPYFHNLLLSLSRYNYLQEILIKQKNPIVSKPYWIGFS